MSLDLISKLDDREFEHIDICQKPITDKVDELHAPALALPEIGSGGSRSLSASAIV